MERMEIYKMGLRAGIKVFYPLVELAENVKDQNGCKSLYTLHY